MISYDYYVAIFTWEGLFNIGMCLMILQYKAFFKAFLKIHLRIVIAVRVFAMVAHSRKIDLHLVTTIAKTLIAITILRSVLLCKKLC